PLDNFLFSVSDVQSRLVELTGTGTAFARTDPNSATSPTALLPALQSRVPKTQNGSVSSYSSQHWLGCARMEWGNYYVLCARWQRQKISARRSIPRKLAARSTGLLLGPGRTTVPAPSEMPHGRRRDGVAPSAHNRIHTANVAAVAPARGQHRVR